MLTLEDVFKEDELNLSKKEIINDLSKFGDISKQEEVWLNSRLLLNKLTNKKKINIKGI